MGNICYSSEIYHLDPKDIISLKDSDIKNNIEAKDEVIILIGSNKTYWNAQNDGTPDTLLRGRRIVEEAVKNGTEYIPARIAFVSHIAKYDFISPLIRVLRYRHKFYSSNIYHIDPFEIREKRIERNFRNAENAYRFSNPKYKMTKETRQKMYQDLVDSMRQNGYDDRFPLDIMLCRNMGIQDTLNQGHHRMSVAIDCKMHRVSVIFSAAGQAPKFLHPFFRIIAKLNLLFKQ